MPENLKDLRIGIITLVVMPATLVPSGFRRGAGIQENQNPMDSRGNDGKRYLQTDSKMRNLGD